MTDIKKMRDTLRVDDTVYLKVKLTEGSFVNEMTSWVFWDDANETVYAICMPDSVGAEAAYNYMNPGVPEDLSRYVHAQKTDARIFMVYAYTYDSIIGMQTIYDKTMSVNLMDKYLASLSGDAKTQLENAKKRFEKSCLRLIILVCIFILC